MNSKKDFWKDSNPITERENVEAAPSREEKEIVESLAKEKEKLGKNSAEDKYESLFTHYFYDKPNGNDTGLCKRGDVLKVKEVDGEPTWGETTHGFVKMMYLKRLV